MKEELVAPCGLNCNLCSMFLSKEKGLYKSPKSGCSGCLPGNKHCSCESIEIRAVRFCFECDRFPCDIINRLEKRYSKKYHTSVLKNLKYIRESGLEQFLIDEKVKWKCEHCGGVISMHTSTCFDCGKEKAF